MKTTFYIDKNFDEKNNKIYPKVFRGYGCGCCGSDFEINKEDLKQHIEDRKEELQEAIDLYREFYGEIE